MSNEGTYTILKSKRGVSNEGTYTTHTTVSQLEAKTSGSKRADVMSDTCHNPFLHILHRATSKCSDNLCLAAL